MGSLTNTPELALALIEQAPGLKVTLDYCTTTPGVRQMVSQPIGSVNGDFAYRQGDMRRIDVGSIPGSGQVQVQS
ncbi:MAG: hypothetical protein ACYDBJ_09170 [Aggregatilineales bacterium]